MKKGKKPRSLYQMLITASGRVWMYWPPRLEVIKRCKIADKPGWFRCEDKECLRETEKIQVDHINPVIKPEDGFVDWNRYYDSKFVQADKLQGLCRESHKKKTQEENKVRRLCKKLKKNV